MPPNKITSFTGRYRFLSNFYPAEVGMDGIKYRTLEHAYQARKTDILAERELIRNAKTPGEAKRLGRRVTLAQGWDGARVAAMRELLRQKFSDNVLKEELLSTGNAELIEGNHWKDTFWGVSGGHGDNWLGRLLMEVREEIREKG